MAAAMGQTRLLALYGDLLRLVYNDDSFDLNYDGEHICLTEGNDTLMFEKAGALIG